MVEWCHYVPDGEGRYRYVGLCAGIDHQGADPHDHEPCCCGRPGCGGCGPRSQD